MEKRLKTARRKAIDATVTGPKKVVKKLQAYYQQGGRWYKVGRILQ